MAERTKTTNRTGDDHLRQEEIALLTGNKPPQALDIEAAVLGSMLLEPACVDEAMEELTASCFYDQHNRTVFEAVVKLYNEHSPVDILSVSAQLKAMGKLEEVGGPVYLAGLSEKVGSAAHIEFYLKVLKQKTIQRELITAAHDILKDAYDDSVPVENLIDKSQSKVYEAIQSNAKKEVEDIGSVIKRAMNRIEDMQGVEGLSGVPSGFPTLDRITNGWQDSDLIILAARPSVGKTAFSLNLARNAAVEHHIPVAFFSLEMSSLQLAMRLMTSESGLPADKIKGGQKLEDGEWGILEESIKNLAKAPLYIDDTPGLPLMEFRTKAKALVKNKKVRLIIVDYLQLMQGPVESKGAREQEVATISRTLKATAKELNVPIIALSQLSRNAVQRQAGNGKPQLSDLRESGSIEQDADMVLFIHRPDFVGLSDDPESKGKTQLVIAKHRNGEVCDIEMIFKAERVRFIEAIDALYEQAATYSSRMNDEPMPEQTQWEPFPPAEYPSNF